MQVGTQTAGGHPARAVLPRADVTFARARAWSAGGQATPVASESEREQQHAPSSRGSMKFWATGGQAARSSTNSSSRRRNTHRQQARRAFRHELADEPPVGAHRGRTAISRCARVARRQQIGHVQHATSSTNPTITIISCRPRGRFARPGDRGFDERPEDRRAPAMAAG